MDLNTTRPASDTAADIDNWIRTSPPNDLRIGAAAGGVVIHLNALACIRMSRALEQPREVHIITNAPAALSQTDRAWMAATWALIIGAALGPPANTIAAWLLPL